MQYVKPDIATICTGQASSMAALLLAAGSKGKRYALDRINRAKVFHPNQLTSREIHLIPHQVH